MRSSSGNELINPPTSQPPQNEPRQSSHDHGDLRKRRSDQPLVSREVTFGNPNEGSAADDGYAMTFGDKKDSAIKRIKKELDDIT